MLPYSFSDLVANIIRTHSAADDQPDRCAIEQSDQEPIVQPDFFADQLGPNNVPDGIRSERLASIRPGITDRAPHQLPPNGKG